MLAPTSSRAARGHGLKGIRLDIGQEPPDIGRGHVPALGLQQQLGALVQEGVPRHVELRLAGVKRSVMDKSYFRHYIGP